MCIALKRPLPPDINVARCGGIRSVCPRAKQMTHFVKRRVLHASTLKSRAREAWRPICPAIWWASFFSRTPVPQKGVLDCIEGLVVDRYIRATARVRALACAQPNKICRRGSLRFLQPSHCLAMDSRMRRAMLRAPGPCRAIAALGGGGEGFKSDLNPISRGLWMSF